jgi:hypothetical protein
MSLVILSVAMSFVILSVAKDLCTLPWQEMHGFVQDDKVTLN